MIEDKDLKDRKILKYLHLRRLVHALNRGIDLTPGSRDRRIIDNGKRNYFARATGVQELQEQRATKAHSGGSAMSTTDSCGNTRRRRGWTRGVERM